MAKHAARTKKRDIEIDQLIGMWTVNIRFDLREPIPREENGSFVLLHFTGGVIARNLIKGWTLEPVPYDGKPHIVGFVPHALLPRLFSSTDLRPIFYEQSSVTDGVRRSFIKPWVNSVNADPRHARDLWSAIAKNYLDTEDGIKEKANHIALSLTNINTHVARICRSFSQQLFSALLSGDDAGDRKFSNLTDHEISASLHDFYAAIGTARDHLGALIALRLGKPPRINDFARLLAVLKRPGEFDDAMLTTLTDGGHIVQSGTACSAGDALQGVGQVRKRLIHHAPYGSRENENWGQTATSLVTGALKINSYKRTIVDDNGVANDLLTQVRHDYLYIMNLFSQLAESSGYSMDIQTITEAGIKELKITPRRPSEEG